MERKEQSVAYHSIDTGRQVSPRKHKVPCYGRAFLRFSVLPGVLVFLNHREYCGDSPASRRFCYDYQVDLYRRTIRTARPQLLVGHIDSVNHLLQLNGKTLVSASDDGTLRVWCNQAGSWKGVQTLTLHYDCVSGLSALSPYRFVSCSHDADVIIWHEFDGAWHAWKIIPTGLICSDVLVLTPENFIITTNVGAIGNFHINDMSCRQYWYDHYHDAILHLDKLDAESFVLCTMNGFFGYWQRRRNGWYCLDYACPASIRNDGNNYPVKSVPLCEGLVAACYTLGHIVIWWRHQCVERQERVAWRVMQILEHGDEEEIVKGIMPISDAYFASYSDDASIIFWRLQQGVWEPCQRLDKHRYPVAECLKIFPEHFWSLDNSGVIHCWYKVGSQWHHERKMTFRRRDYSDEFARTGGMRIIGFSDEIATFSEDCLIRIWPLYRLSADNNEDATA